MDKIKKLIKIFLITFRIGLFTFGGGGTMMIMLQREFVDKLHWLDDESMADVLAVARSLPGVVSINTSIIAGYRLCGVMGGIISGVGSALPSLIVLVFVTMFYNKLISSVFFTNALRAVRGVVVALLIATAIRLKKSAVKDIYGQFIFWGTAVLAILFRSVNVIFFIFGALLLGLLIYYFQIFKKKEKK